MASLRYDSTTGKWVPVYSYTGFSDDELKSDRQETEQYQYQVQNGTRCAKRFLGVCVRRAPTYETRTGTRGLSTNGVPNSTLNSDGRSNQKAKAKGEAENTAVNTLIQKAQTSKGGDYVSVRNSFLNTDLGLVENGYTQDKANEFKNALVDSFKDFYRSEKLESWDPALGSKPLYGDFQPSYYEGINPVAAQQYSAAVANDDIDITERYGKQIFTIGITQLKENLQD
jgi:hypothetical protein